jgi:predicted porin
MNLKKTLMTALPLGLVAMGAHAQSSVTLYGVIDTGVEYLNNKGGHSFVGLNEGIWGGERFGLKGKEDLGGGTAAIFQLENGFNTDTGAEQKSGVLFNRSAWVGLTNTDAGTLTLGRQYTPYYTLLAPWSPTNWLTGAIGAHPGDLDNLDTDYRVSNSVAYKSPSFGGLTVGALYAFGGQAGSFSLGQSWSVAAQYQAGPAGLGVGYERFDNAAEGGGAWSANSTAYSGTGEQGNTGITAGYQTAAAQNRLAVTGGYAFNSQFDVSASYSNVQYVAGPNSSFHGTAIFNTGGIVLHYRPVTAWDLAVGYAYTRATESNGISAPAGYSQINLTQLYNLSKRTKIYVLEAYQHASGQTIGSNGKITDAVANIAEASASSNRNQVAATVGINHTF